ncbi:unnamed protein product [Arabis nemorensis]|uniref:Pentatricopeptide repeat-containing protein n=1 Tax=Arabis nemorensis TaxID=586526 RepID=A0A565C5Y8_9BRAS|nr:unnamed protein product [Arabis nemorensis]
MNKLRKIHSHVIINGLQHHPSIFNNLLRFCAVYVTGNLSYSLLLFEQFDSDPSTDKKRLKRNKTDTRVPGPLGPSPNLELSSTCAWNSLVRGFSVSSSLLLYNRMILSSVSRPDIFTFSFALKASEKLCSIPKCLELHGSIIRSGFLSDAIVSTSLVRYYSANERMDIASKVFDEMHVRDLVSWNAMISCPFTCWFTPSSVEYAQANGK